ncbi:hypothetical protein CFOL_v3_19507 [Cephalotus follicularis]|uniref:Uncharacterized protein n=1 Tax=Cephalotus follicularis TaxID=3775 RepID=A0A1Q3C7G4_CEPFO|nr:hypothetical protein CFOL_v3_19507 [Cephalotus follicularis]
MRPFGEAKLISGHQTLKLMRRPYGVKGSVEKKRSRFDSAQPNDISNTNDLCLECVARSLL